MTWGVKRSIKQYKEHGRINNMLMTACSHRQYVFSWLRTSICCGLCFPTLWISQLCCFLVGQMDFTLAIKQPLCNHIGNVHLWGYFGPQNLNRALTLLCLVYDKLVIIVQWIHLPAINPIFKGQNGCKMCFVIVLHSTALPHRDGEDSSGPLSDKVSGTRVVDQF